MKILFVASLHHSGRAAPPATRSRLFPPSMAQALLGKGAANGGHTLDVFWRTRPSGKTCRHAAGITCRPAKLLEAALNRVPPQINPDSRARNAALLAKSREFRPRPGCGWWATTP
ncbi:MAG: hypothetical protein U0703_23000 [Anaerolineae bacterium]